MPGWVAPTTERWTVGDDISWCQLSLHDDGALFPRDELLRWYTDAYRQLLSRAQATRQWRILDMPPRHTVTYTHTWERQYTWNGMSRQLGYQGPSGSAYTYPWEVEQAEGIPVTDGAALLCTQLWEYAYRPSGSSTDQHYTFAVPRSHERIARVYWDHQALASRSVMELDGTEAPWWRESGEPWIWTRGTQGQRHFDIYQLQTGYQQGYTLVYQEASNTGGEPGTPPGIVRELSGSRTYAWESDDATLPYGLLREVSSPARQYLAQPTWDHPLGTIREWRSSVSALMLWEVVIPDHPMLDEAETPVMVPAQLQKYLRCYVLWRAFSRQGEGQRLALAAWFEQRWVRGVVLMKRLGWVTRRDRGYGRQGVGARSRAVPRPRLPSDFPRWIGV
jgi:hypothetical protein